MGKGKSLLNRRGPKKTVRLTQEVKRQMDAKMYGETPPPIEDRAGFLNWCKVMVDPNTSREWMDEYLETLGMSTRGVPNEWVNPSVCHRARLKSLGAPFTPEQDKLLDEGISVMLSHAKSVDEAVSDKPTIQDHIREKFSSIMGELEGLLDDGLPEMFSIESWAREKAVSPKIAGMIVAKVKPRLVELHTARSGDDGELDEAYKKYSRNELTLMIDDLKLVVLGLERMLENEKRAKAPRTPKPISLEKKLKRLREVYLKYSKEWNVTSIDPSKIIGAKELWTLNVKYKLLTVFRTDGMGGQLDVKTCNVTGFSSDSQTYRLGRGKKQFSVVEEVLKAPKAGLKKLVLDLNKSDYLLERINENTVLLRVL